MSEDQQSGSDSTPPLGQARPQNRIQVSREKRPLSFFINLSKKFLKNEEEVELSGLGLAVTSVVTIAELLKSGGYIKINGLQTSLVQARDSSNTKAKIQIWISKTDRFFELTARHPPGNEIGMIEDKNETEDEKDESHGPKWDREEQ